MNEFHTNDYVIKIEGGHPGYVKYTILSTPAKMKELAEKIMAALDQPVTSFRQNDQNLDSPTEIWNDYATVAYGKTSRVYLSIALSDDINSYHTKPSLWTKVTFFLNCCFILILLLFAIIGSITTLNYIMSL